MIAFASLASAPAKVSKTNAYAQWTLAAVNALLNPVSLILRQLSSRHGLIDLLLRGRFERIVQRRTWDTKVLRKRIEETVDSVARAADRSTCAGHARSWRLRHGDTADKRDRQRRGGHY
jgi:hypothetical protein